MAFETATGIGHFRAQVLDSREHGIKRAEVSLSVISDNSRQGRLSNAGWSMQDQISYPIG